MPSVFTYKLMNLRLENMKYSIYNMYNMLLINLYNEQTQNEYFREFSKRFHGVGFIKRKDSQVLKVIKWSNSYTTNK